jgi:predicted CxxxxCH...CXXCH cytochrome family protein
MIEMKMKIIKSIFAFFALALVFASCTDVQENIVENKALGIHPEGWKDVASANFHGNYLKENDWNLQICQSCHAADYSGGTAEESCRTCHQSEQGPESCNTCHGDFNNGIFTDSTRIAPPRMVFPNHSSDSSAHTGHLYQNSLTDNVDCAQCHKVPQYFDEPGHIVKGATEASITFGELAKMQGNSPEYNSGSKTCSYVYCHGSFTFLKDSSANSWVYIADTIKGNFFNPVWTKLDGSQGECGTCHMLPPKGHQNEGTDPEATTCATCHSGVVDANGNIIDKTKHINGKINVFGN